MNYRRQEIGGQGARPDSLPGLDEQGLEGEGHLALGGETGQNNLQLVGVKVLGPGDIVTWASSWPETRWATRNWRTLPCSCLASSL